MGSGLAFEGYTGGETKDSIDGLLSIGDVGHFDDDGHLFVGGRDDEMIVSGGENVYPREVEDLLADHPDVAEVAVIGVDDEDYGQRLGGVRGHQLGASPDEAELRSHVRENLANYKVKKSVVFLDELRETKQARSSEGACRGLISDGFRSGLEGLRARWRAQTVGLADVGALDWAGTTSRGSL